MSIEEARLLVQRANWYHRFELLPGLITPGVSEMHAGAACDALGIPKNLTGKRAVDIGAWDGPITFELERRGAHAIAVDIQDPDRVGFNVAKRVLGSKAEHHRLSVYDIPTPSISDLDLVVFRGVFYHLKHPLLAFDRLNAAMKLGATLYFEGEAFLHYAEDLSGRSVSTDWERIAALDVPLCLSYPNKYKNASNWFIPNVACMRSWLQSTGFEPAEIHTFRENGAQRLYGRAVKIAGGPQQAEHPIY